MSGPTNGAIIVNGDGTVDYTHDGSETIADSFTYTIRDAAGQVSNTATVTLTITPQDDNPVLGNNQLTITEGGTVILTGAELSATDAETLDSTLQFTVSGVTGGQFELVASPGVAITTFSQQQITDGDVQFVHDGGEAAPAYSVTVSDGALTDGPLAATITFTNVNDSPTASADADTALEGGTITIDLAVNDTDPDDGLDLTSIQIVSGPTNGSIIVNGDGTVDYTHDGSETVADSFTYTIRDAAGQVSNTATVTLTITPQDDNPVLGNNQLTITEGGTVILTGAELSATDAETLDSTLQFTVSGVTGGQFELVASPGVAITTFSQQQITDGDVQFVHDGGEAAPSYSVTVSDGALTDGPLAATITFTNVNDSPTANADADTTLEGGTVTIDLAVNDTDPDDGLDLTSIQIVSGPTNGSIIVNGDGTVDYSHDGSETVADSFTYTIRDAAGQVSNTATVTLTITPQDDDPVLGNNQLTITEGGTVILTGGEMSATDAETLDSTLQFTVSGVTGGQFELVASPGVAITTFSQQQITDGDVQFVHDGGEAAPSYSVTVSDGALTDGPLAATITFTNVNDAPTATADADTTLEGGTVTIDLAVNDTDPDDGLDLTSIQIVSGPTNGAIAINGDGTVDYTHDGSETIADSFTYMIRDAAGQVSNTATVTLTITPQDDNPVLGNNQLTITEGGTVILTGAEVSASDAETAAGLLQFTVSGVTGGQFELVASPGVAITSFSQQQITDGDVQFIHDGGEAAPAYSVTVSDGALTDGPLAATITFTNVNDAPTANADADTTLEGGTVTIDLAVNDTDPDDGLDLTSIQIVSGPSNGSVIVNGDGTVDYTHDGSETIADSFTYTIRDAAGQVSNTATVTLTITPQDDNPVLGNNQLTITEGGTVILTGAELSATDAETAAGLLQFTVSGLTGGQFELVASPGVAITTFSQQQITDGDVQFVHDGGETAPAYSVTISDGALTDGPLAATVTFTNVNDAPVIDLDADDSAAGGIDYASSWAEGGGAVLVADADAIVADADNATLQTLLVTISNPLDGALETLAADTTGTSIAASYNSSTNVLTLSGPDSVANYQQVLRTVTYDNASSNPDTTARTIDFIADDGAVLSSTATTVLSMGAFNNPPTAVADADTVLEAGTVTIDLAVNDTDPDDGLDLTSIQIVSGPTNGAIVINGDGTVDYTHDGSETTADSFTYTIRDAAGQVSNAATVSLTITPQDDDPVLGNNQLTITEGGTVILTGAELSATDAETAAGLLQFTVSGVNGGQFELVASPGVAITTFSQQQIADGDVQFAHDGGEAAPSYSVTVSDGALTDGPLAATITFTNVNDAPTANADADSTLEGGTVTIDLAVNDTDPDDGLDLTSIQIVTGPTNGSIVINGDGTVDYTHDGSETIADSFTYTIRDAAGQVSNTATVTLTITPQDDNPVLGNNQLTITEGGTVVLTGAVLSASDAETAAGLLQFTVSGVTGGQFELVASPGVAITTFSQQQIADGDVQFVHDGGEAAPGYSVTVSDGALTDGPLAATITFTNVNDAPAANADADTTLEGGTVAIDLAANDTDPDDGLDLTSIQIVSGPTNGSIVVNGDGTVDYTHDGSETIADSFTYTIRDAAGQVSNTATVTLTITPQDDNPVLGNNQLTITEGGSVILTGAELSATDAETLDSTLQFTVSGVTSGQFELVASPGVAITTFSQQQITDGDVQFVHDGGEAAPAYSVTVSDGALTDGPLAATITFTNVNDSPTANADADTTLEGGTVTIDLAVNDIDPDDGLDPTSIQIVSGPTNGSIVINGDGTVDYTHDGSETIGDSFTYTIRDAAGQVSNAATVTLTITPQDDNPVLGNNQLTITEGGTVILTGAELSATDAETAAGLLQFTVSGVTGGQFELVASPGVAIATFSQQQLADGDVQFVHDGDEAAPAYSVTVSDGALTDGPFAATITFTNVNDAPTANADADTTLEGGTVTIDLAVNDTDPDDGLDLASVQIVSGPTNGSIIINGDGTVDYTHDGSETIGDSFTYTIRDAAGQVSNTATVTLTITPQDDNPVLGNNQLTITEGGSVILTGAELSATDAETTAGLLQFTVSGVTGGQFELVTSPGVAITTFTQQQITDGDVQFVHDGGEAAPSYSVTVSDGALTDGPLAATITFTNVNDSPTANADADTALEGGAVTIDLAVNDTDPDDGLDPTSIQIVSGPTNGSVVINGDGTVDYTHDGSETIADSFTYTIRDAAGQVSNTATVALTITPQDDDPVLGNNQLTITEGGSVILTGAELSATDAETTAGLLQFTVSGVTGGAVRAGDEPGRGDHDFQPAADHGRRRPIRPRRWRGGAGLQRDRERRLPDRRPARGHRHVHERERCADRDRRCGYGPRRWHRHDRPRGQRHRPGRRDRQDVDPDRERAEQRLRRNQRRRDRGLHPRRLRDHCGRVHLHHPRRRRPGFEHGDRHAGNHATGRRAGPRQQPAHHHRGRHGHSHGRGDLGHGRRDGRRPAPVHGLWGDRRPVRAGREPRRRHHHLQPAADHGR